VLKNEQDMRAEVSTTCYVQQVDEYIRWCCDAPGNCRCTNYATCPTDMSQCDSFINRTSDCCGSSCCVREDCTKRCPRQICHDERCWNHYVCCQTRCVVYGTRICRVQCGHCLTLTATYIRDDDYATDRFVTFSCSRDDVACQTELRTKWKTDSAVMCYYDRRSPDDTWFSSRTHNTPARVFMWLFAVCAMISLMALLHPLYVMCHFRSRGMSASKLDVVR